MRASFLRLIAGVVLAFWAAGFLILVLYSRSQSWTEERARQDGVFLAYELLEREAPAQRARRLEELREHFHFDLALLSLEELGRRVGRQVAAGERIPHEGPKREAWYFLAFTDGQGALAAGPVDLAVPPNAVPIGVYFALVGLPLIAFFLAFRVDRSLRKVERASAALADGELDARVDDPSGPSSELAARFNAMAERVERLIRSRDELVQAVSHELGSPLSRLRFHIELLENLSEAEREERLHAMTRDLDALDELVAELLGYVQSDERAVERRTFDPRRSLTDLAELAQLEAAGERAIDVTARIPDDMTVFADERLFQRAVENVLRNAVQHARGKVRLELTQEDEQVHVIVHDDGPGIPENLREKVTIPFFRIEADRGRKTGGVGLGLAIVNRIMQRQGGRLGISDSPLGGAAVRMSWPQPR